MIGVDHISELVSQCNKREGDTSFPAHLRQLQSDKVVTFVGISFSSPYSHQIL